MHLKLLNHSEMPFWSIWSENAMWLKRHVWHCCGSISRRMSGRWGLLYVEKSGSWCKIGSKLFRQKEGIPQGSKISSLLCSIFYAALEARHLSFVHRPGSVSVTSRYDDYYCDWLGSGYWDISMISYSSRTILRLRDVLSKGWNWVSQSMELTYPPGNHSCHSIIPDCGHMSCNLTLEVCPIWSNIAYDQDSLFAGSWLVWRTWISVWTIIGCSMVVSRLMECVDKISDRTIFCFEVESTKGVGVRRLVKSSIGK
jgi:hypothetical protein